MHLIFRPMDEASARAILAWRYDEPYTLYNADPANLAGDLAGFMDPANSYYSVLDERDQVVAFRCFGPDARVSGGDYSADALDTGGGLRPDLTGRGLGLAVLNAGLDHGRRIYHPRAVRVTVAAFNARALRVCAKAGFQPVQTFRRASDGKDFVVMMREDEEGGAGAMPPRDNLPSLQSHE